MISRLHGTVVERLSSGAIVIDCHGVGYEVLPTSKLVDRIVVGQNATVVVFTDVREDSIKLFGFADNSEREVFNLLLRVSGVGTKIARDIVSSLDSQSLLRAIGRADISSLQAIKGIGKKTAERIVLELRDRVAEFVGLEVGTDTSKGSDGTTTDGTMSGDAIEALVNLGFRHDEAQRAVKTALGESGLKAASLFKDAGQLVTSALKFV